MFKTHSRQIQNIFKKFCENFFDESIFGLKIFLVPNMLGPKFLLDLSYHSYNIHIQNTFQTDSKQIKKILENVCGSKYFWTQIYFGP